MKLPLALWIPAILAHDTRGEDAFQAFQTKYNRDAHAPDAALRRQLFAETLRKVEAHNAEYAAGRKRFKMGINQFSDRTKEEYRAVLGFRKAERTERAGRLPFPLDSQAPPRSVDWRDHGKVSLVKDQGRPRGSQARGVHRSDRGRRSGALTPLCSLPVVEDPVGTINSSC